MDLVDRYCSVPEAERDEIRKKWADGDPFELSGDWWKLTSKHEKYSSARRIRTALIYISIGEPQKKGIPGMADLSCDNLPQLSDCRS